MDFLISLIRFPVGITLIPLLALFWLACWPLEIILGVICLPFAAIFMGRADIKNSWLGEWPYMTLRRIPEDSEKIWGWIFDD